MPVHFELKGNWRCKLASRVSKNHTHTKKKTADIICRIHLVFLILNKIKMLRNQTQGAAMLVHSLPTKSRKSVSRDIFATHADLVYDIIDNDYRRHNMAVTHYHVFMTILYF